MVLVQKLPFFQPFFLGNIDQENVFYDILERKNDFLPIKIKVQKVEKLRFFHGFGPKMAIIPNFFLGDIDQGNVFYDILEQKKDFLRHKKKKFKKSNNCDLSKGVNPWFWSKHGHFSNFFF